MANDAKDAPSREAGALGGGDKTVGAMPGSEDHPQLGGLEFEIKSEQARLRQAVMALASGDLGSARKALFGHPDRGINTTDGSVSNPVPDEDEFTQLHKDKRAYLSNESGVVSDEDKEVAETRAKALEAYNKVWEDYEKKREKRDSKDS